MRLKWMTCQLVCTLDTTIGYVTWLEQSLPMESNVIMMNYCHLSIVPWDKEFWGKSSDNKFVHYPNDEEEENDALERKGHPPLFRHDE